MKIVFSDFPVVNASVKIITLIFYWLCLFKEYLGLAGPDFLGSTGPRVTLRSTFGYFDPPLWAFGRVDWIRVGCEGAPRLGRFSYKGLIASIKGNLPSGLALWGMACG